MICLLTPIRLTPGGSSTVHIYTQTIHRTTQNKQYIEQHKIFERLQAVPHLCGFYPAICLTTVEKARKTLSQTFVFYRLSVECKNLQIQPKFVARLHAIFTMPLISLLNPLKPNDAYRRRTAPLTSKVAFYIFIQQI